MLTYLSSSTEVFCSCIVEVSFLRLDLKSNDLPQIAKNFMPSKAKSANVVNVAFN